ncbi:MAG: mechanosensitive ion channel family protein [Bacteroidia bacterium]|nr:mechanosensitive ion channel family protein [Bacteroidia bacterium]
MKEQFQQSFEKLFDKTSGWIDSIILSLPNLILAFLIVLGSVFIAGRIKKFSAKYMRKIMTNPGVAGILSNLVVVLFMLLVLFLVLSILDLSEALTAFLGTAGVAGLAIGFALQDPMINLFSGMLMSVKDYYKLGDLVEIKDYFGYIQKINLRSTILLTLDGQEVVIPNKDVLQSPLKNYAHTPRRRIDINCGVSYGDELEKVREIALEALSKSGLDIRESEPIEFFFTGFGDSSIDFSLRFWKNIYHQEDYLEARDKAIVALKTAFDENGITIPFPIRTLDFGVVGGTRLDQLAKQKPNSINQN